MVLVGLEVGGPEGDGPGVECPGDLGDTVGELVDELLGPSVGDDGAGVLSDVVGEQELGPEESDSVAGELCDLLSLGGHGDVAHDLGSGDGAGLGEHGGGLGLGFLLGFLLDLTAVDGSGGSVDGDDLSVLQVGGGGSGSDDAGGSELPGDDCCVAGHSSLVGDDGDGPGHGGDHVGHGHLGDQDVAVLDDVEGHTVLVDADLTGGHAGAGPETGEEDLSSVDGLSGGRIGGTDGGDGPGLDEEYLSVLDAPFHVHGLVVVDLDLPSDLGDLEDAGVGDILHGLHGLGDVLLHGSALGTADVLPGLFECLLAADGHLGLVDDVVVGSDLSADHGLAETVTALDDDVLGPVVGVHGEHDSGVLGVDHLLDDDGELDVLVGVALGFPVVDGPGGEEGGPALLDLVYQVLLVLDVEVGLLLSGEGCIGEILCGGGGPYCDESLLSAEEELVTVLDLLLEVLGDGAFVEECPDLFGGRIEAVVGGAVDALEEGEDLVHDSARGDKVVVRNGGENESVGDGESGGGKLSEVRSFASDDRDVGDAEFVHIDDSSRVFDIGHVNPLSFFKRFGGVLPLLVL